MKSFESTENASTNYRRGEEEEKGKGINSKKKKKQKTKNKKIKTKTYCTLLLRTLRCKSYTIKVQSIHFINFLKTQTKKTQELAVIFLLVLVDWSKGEVAKCGNYKVEKLLMSIRDNKQMINNKTNKQNNNYHVLAFGRELRGALRRSMDQSELSLLLGSKP